MSDAFATLPPRHRVPAGLKPYVDEYHAYDYETVPSVHRGLPSTSITLVLSFGKPLDLSWHGRPASRTSLWATASGLSATSALIHQTGRESGIQLGLTPRGARALFGMPARELADELAELADVLGRSGADLYEEVEAQPDWSTRFAVLDRHLLDLASRGDDATTAPELDRAWTSLTNRAPQSVQTVADDVGWSRRHLTERFTREYGIGPKVAGRLSRFQQSVQLLRRAPFSGLADVAYTCGYADQPHLNRDWRQFAGTTPTAWMRAELPETADREFPFVQDDHDAQLAGSRP